MVYSTLVKLVHWYICIYPSLFPVTLWELEVAQGVPKSERESWLVESVETLLRCGPHCGDPINMCGDLVVGYNVETKVVDISVW